MAEVVVVIHPVAFNRAFKSWTGSPLGTWMAGKTAAVNMAARAEAPGPGKPPRNRTRWNYATGELQSQIVTNHAHAPFGDLEGHVIALADHALMVHEGTLPHVILPKQSPVLVFRVRSGPVVYARRVNHPGTEANPFLVRALEDSLRQ